MNQILKDKLSIIVEDKLLIQAIRAVFDERIKKNSPVAIDDDKKLGENYRAYLKAKEITDEAFKDLLTYQRGTKKNKTHNRAK